MMVIWNPRPHLRLAAICASVISISACAVSHPDHLDASGDRIGDTVDVMHDVPSDALDVIDAMHDASDVADASDVTDATDVVDAHDVIDVADATDVVDVGDVVDIVDVPTTCTGTQVRCGTLCADLSSDGTNCGSCGHACGGGACNAGVCQPYVFAAVTGAKALALDATNLYVGDSLTGVITRVPLASPGSPSMIITAPSTGAYAPFALAVDATNVYWSDSGRGSVRQFHLDGTGSVTDTVTGLTNIGPFLYTPTMITWAPDFVGSVVVSSVAIGSPGPGIPVLTAGCSGGNIVGLTPSVPAPFGPFGAFCQGSSILWTHGASGIGPITYLDLMAPREGGPVVSDSTYLYTSSSGTGEILRTTYVSPITVTRLASQPSAWGVAISIGSTGVARTLYYTAWGSNSVWALAL